MKNIILSLLLVTLTSFENQVFVEAQKKQGKGGRPMMDGDMKKAPAGWEPPGDIPPPPPGWQPGDPIPPPPEGWTPPNEDNAPSNGKSKRGGKDGKKPFMTGNKEGKRGKDGAKGGRPPMDGAGGKGKRPEKNEAPKQSNWKPASAQLERQIGDIIDIKDSKQIHEKIVDLNNLKIREPYFMFFMNQTCDECKQAATELAKLGKMMQDQPKIARADCTYDQEACDLFINHIDASKDVFPFMIMATPTRSYIYSGPINAQQIHDDFLSGNKFEKFPVHGGKGMSTSQVLEGGMKYISQQTFDRDQEMRKNDPLWIDEGFAYFFASSISSLFFHIGYDYWRKEAKILVFITGVLIPVCIIVYQGAMSFIAKDKNEQKIEKALKKIKPY